MAAPMSLHMFFPALPGVKATMGVDESLAQLTVSLPMFVMAFLMLAYGSLSDRLGRRPVLIGGILLFVVGSALAAVADSIWLLLAARCVQAAGGACGGALTRAIARDVYGADRLVKMIAYLTMAFALGPMIAVPLSGQMVDHLGWRSVLVFAAIAGLVIVACVVFVVRESHHPTAAPTTGSKRARLIGDYAILLRNIRFQGFIWQSAMTSAAFFVVAPGAAIVMVDYLDYSAAEFGMWFPMLPVGFLLGNFAASRFSGRASVETMVLASSLVHVLGVCLLILFAALDILLPVTILGPGAILTFAGGLGLSNAQAGAIRLAGDRAGTGAGLGAFLQMFCGASFTQIFGIVADGTITPFVTVVAVTGLFALLAGCVPYMLRRREIAGSAGR